jgi:hypothetical protein
MQASLTDRVWLLRNCYPKNVKATTFRATRNPSNGEISVVRMPMLDGLENTFMFRDWEEIRSILILRHPEEDVDRIVKDLNDFGSADFS